MIELPDANVVHVWEAACDAGAWRQATDESVMSEDERARADRFIDERARSRFIAGRLSLRHVLAGYLDVAAASIRFDTSPLGKPRLGHPHASSGIHFNISHSGDLILLGIARCEIGLDVEEVRTARFNDNLIRRVFSAREQALIEASPDPQRTCFQLWVRKEASVKATGVGLVSDLAALDVSEGKCATPVADAQVRVSIRCIDLSLGSMYAAAVASSAATEVRQMARQNAGELFSIGVLGDQALPHAVYQALELAPVNPVANHHQPDHGVVKQLLNARFPLRPRVPGILR